MGFPPFSPNRLIRMVQTNTYRYYYKNTIIYLYEYSIAVPKISLDMPAEIIDDLKVHVGDEKKYISLADAVRTACRRLLDQLDEIDRRHGRLDDNE